MSIDLTGKRLLITGSDTGIGRGAALELAKRGADIALHYPHTPEGAQTAAEEIRAQGGKAEAFGADFTRLEEVCELGRKALAFLGGLDGLINNAGITMNRPFEQVTPEQYDTLYAVNVRAPFFLTQTVLPALRESQGSVINLASIHAYQGNPEHAVYAGTKGAMVAYTRELAIELALQGVRVNAIAPGAVVVENYYAAMPDYDPQAAGRSIPAGFVGRPTDIANVMAFLLSPESRYIVGQTLIVDGGTTSWMPFTDAFRQPHTAQYGKGYVPGL